MSPLPPDHAVTVAHFVVALILLVLLLVLA